MIDEEEMSSAPQSPPELERVEMDVTPPAPVEQEPIIPPQKHPKDWNVSICGPFYVFRNIKAQSMKLHCSFLIQTCLYQHKHLVSCIHSLPTLILGIFRSYFIMFSHALNVHVVHV